jgi:hypothetical protein
MNDIERRTLVGAAVGAGIGAIAALSRAGPLIPPPGPVAPSGRTLDEIYNRIPAVGGSDGRTPVDTAPFTILNPGSYILTGNLSGSATVLTIAADGVTIDLNGFTIRSSGSASTAVVINGSHNNVTIRNGNVVGGSVGIGTAGAIADTLIEDVRVSNAKIGGIIIGSAGSRGCIIRRCKVNSTGVTTAAADGSLGVSGLGISGHSCRVEDCTVSRLFYNGSGSPTFRGINFNNSAATGNIVSRCTVSHDAAITAIAINFPSAATTGVYRDCTVTNFSTPYSGGTSGGGNV